MRKYENGKRENDKKQWKMRKRRKMIKKMEKG